MFGIGKDVQVHYSFLIFIVLTLLWNVRGQYRSVDGTQIYDFKVDRVFSNIIDSFDQKSVVECSSLCLGKDNCISFFYNDVESKCITHSVPFQNLSTSSTGGWKYYQVNSDDNCDPRQGYSHNRKLNICYKFVREVASNMDRDRQKNQCKQESAELIKITTSEIQNHIAEYLDQFYTPLTTVQGSDAAMNYNWTFDDGTELKYTCWAPNEPYNGFSSDYLYLKQSEGYKWTAMPDIFYYAELIGGFICSKKI